MSTVIAILLVAALALFITGWRAYDRDNNKRLGSISFFWLVVVMMVAVASTLHMANTRSNMYEAAELQGIAITVSPRTNDAMVIMPCKFAVDFVDDMITFAGTSSQVSELDAERFCEDHR